jgi:hypothetical protein
MKTLIEYFKMIIGTFLLVVIVIFWITALILTAIVEVVTWFELKLTKLMKKCYGELK